jgi:hypothetical protein
MHAACRSGAAGRAAPPEVPVPDPLVLPVDGEPLTPRSTRWVIGDALTLGVDTVVVPVERLEPGFFDLQSGVAGDIVQAFVTYGLRLVVLGELPPVAAASRSFAAFVLEANRGGQTWFVDSLAALEAKLAAQS